jgi:dolichyl-phosphate-mannose--protein O-mannosyl transferase
LQAIIGNAVLAWHQIDPTDLPTDQEIVTNTNIRLTTSDVPYPLPHFYWWGRAVTAVLGSLSVVLTYFIGRAVKSSMVGLISAFFLAANALHAEHAHYITRTAPGLFFLLLAFFIIQSAFLKRNWWLHGLSLPVIYLAI